ncbi:MFS general substrate transporter [Polychaeton citri CBS 116435]|uniref:MFS general substrate transporter n=1 Tax=Polychaeton citri CBS 116435 TaxID=1314669 RepID=A0A9P4Q2I1_9PEZI|nr:MFS general substrate transporter [Polychaeton citri CBS 116435]
MGGGSDSDYETAQVEKVEESCINTESFDPELDKRITRKFDKHIVPWLFGIWLLAFIDRSNIGNAKIDGLIEDLGLDGKKFNVALSVFYIPYIVVDVPSNWVVKYFKAGYYLPALLLSWGLVCMCTGFVKNYAGLLAARFFLGLAEGGLLGGMIIYLAMFYRRHQMMYRIGLFYCAAPLSGAFGGALATGLAQISTPGYDGWPFIFFVEGAITIVYGLVCIWFMPHTPSDAKFLTDEERAAALKRMLLDSQGAASNDEVKHETFDWRWVRMALANWNTVLLSLLFFLIITPIYSYSLFLPTINTGLGFSKTEAQGFSAPPNLCAAIVVLLTCWVSDKTQRRGLYMLIGCAVAIVGYIMLISTPNRWVQWAGTFFVACGIFPCSPLVMGWLSNNLAPHYVRATGTGFQIMIANFSAFIATFTYLPADAPRYITGHAINLGMLGLALVTIAVTMTYQKWENRQRELGKRDHLLESVDDHALGHRHPSFKYTI